MIDKINNDKNEFAWKDWLGQGATERDAAAFLKNIADALREQMKKAQEATLKNAKEIK